MNEIIYGINAILALLEKSPERLLDVYIMKEREDRRFKLLLEQLAKIGIFAKTAKPNWIKHTLHGAVHQGIVALTKAPRQLMEYELPELLDRSINPLLLILDGVTDPHNLGSCLRSADAAGVNAVIIPRDRSAQLNSIAKKVASGAAENIPLIRVTNLVRTIKLLKIHDIFIIGTDSEADKPLYQSDLTIPLALIVGSEGQGIRRLTRDNCDEILKIPMSVGAVSSINVSIAAGVCLFETMRQRLWN